MYRIHKGVLADVTVVGSSTALTQKSEVVGVGGFRQRPAQMVLQIVLTVGGRVGIAIIVCFFALPYVWMVSSSLKPFDEIMQNVFPLTWKTFVPVQPTFQNFVEIFTQQDFGQYFYKVLKRDRKSTRLNSSHQIISYAVFCLKKKKKNQLRPLAA